MDRAKKARTPVRTRVTKLCNEIAAEIATQVPLKKRLMELLKQLEVAREELRSGDEKVMEAMLDENKTDQELETEDEDIQVYINKIISVKEDVEYTTSPQSHQETSSVRLGDNKADSKTYKLPKIELPKFNGELKGWLGWWSQFEKIDKDPGLHNSDKFQYLIQATEEKSEPREIISAFPPTSDNYSSAIDSLKRRYGREGLQLQVYLRELLNLAIVNVTQKEKIPLDKLYLKLESHLRALNTLDLSKAEPSMYFYPLVESSLPEEVLRTWLRSPEVAAARSGSVTKLDNLMNFIKKEVEGEQQIHLAKNAFQEKQQSGSQKQKKVKSNDETGNIATAAALYAAEAKSQKCIFCDKLGHKSQVCLKAKKMTLDEKVAKVKSSNACFKCLKRGHISRRCQAQINCGTCGKSHYQLMCQGETQNDDQVKEITEGVKTMVTSQGASLTLKASTPHKAVPNLILRGTMRVKVKGSNSQEVTVRVLVDSGSDVSYIKKELADKLKLKPVGKRVFHTEVFGGSYEITEREEYLVQLQGINGGKADLKMFSEKQICGVCDPIPYGTWVQELMKLKVYLTDVATNPSEIHMLIGSNHMGKILTGRMIKVSPSVTATETSIGWYVNGEVSIEKQHTMASRSIAMTSKSLEITALWDLDALGIKDSAIQTSTELHDREIKENFQKNLRRAEDGRYIVKLPWISDSIPLPHNREVAEKRLRSATNKLIMKKEFDRYDNIFRAWELEGIIEECAEKEEKHDGHFLPHRPVFKPESLTTPVRPVFDASCRIGSKPSLNQCLEKGPNLLELILAILLRFRKKRVAGIADIRKAFQMIDVDHEDRKFQKFLWWLDKERTQLKVYQHCRVIFGMNCSPFVLAAVLDFHLTHFSEVEKKTSLELLRSLYVDNCVTSFDNKFEYEEFKKESTSILAKAKMDLRQWESNADDEMEREVASVLGYKWCKREDQLYCDLPTGWEKDSYHVITKRTVLSLASQVFDPIGFTSPAILQLKMLLQEAWAQDLKWDEVWDEANSQKVAKWCDQMSSLAKVKLPRCAVENAEDLQLHVFTDGSKCGYGGVVFVRTQNEQGQASVRLLLAKSRVAPLEKKRRSEDRVTIPRLELLGCLVGARLADTVKKAMEYEKKPIFYWSDSTTALAWIKRDEEWGTFVGNRARSILKISQKAEWRHVPGKLNPADLPSRGCSPNALLMSKWWEGPDWLYQSEENWPKSVGPVDEEEVLAEKKKSTFVNLANAKPTSFQTKFASYFKNVRIVGYMMRILKGMNKTELRKTWTLAELRKAELAMLNIMQPRYFADAKKIQPRVEKMKDGLLHVKSKLEYKEDTDGFRFPILLPNKCPLVHELIREVHRIHSHGGIQFTLTKLREKYWIQQGRKTVKLALRKCVTCRKQDAKPFQVNPVALPKRRVTTGEVFTTTGVDLAGPLYLKDKSKVWVVLYTCAVYRCVALDLVDSLNSEAFINSLERFVNTYGRPNTLYSDNGTNFVGAQNLFKRLNWEKIEKEAQTKQLQWIFNPPTAAWWGGWWERLIKSTKDLLRRMLGKASLTRDELSTCLSSVAATINDRPLTATTEDEEDLVALTPAMFLRGTKMTRFPEAENITGKELQHRYKYVKKLQKDLKGRFRKDYLAELVQKASEKKTRDPCVGDVVLVGADNKKRIEWPLGRITKLNPGKDGEPRSALVETNRGVFSRPLQRLYPLEVPCKSDEFHQPNGHFEERSPCEEDDESEESENDEVDVDVAEPEVITRAGRKVKKPDRWDGFV